MLVEQSKTLNHTAEPRKETQALAWHLLLQIKCVLKSGNYLAPLVHLVKFVPLILIDRQLKCQNLVERNEKRHGLRLVITFLCKKVDSGDVRFNEVDHKHLIKVNKIASLNCGSYTVSGTSALIDLSCKHNCVAVACLL